MEIERKGACFSYLLLCNKLFPNLAAQNNMYVYCFIVFPPRPRQESKYCLAGFPIQELSKAAISVGSAVIISRLNWKGVCFQTPVAEFGYSQAFGQTEVNLSALLRDLFDMIT